MVEQTLDLTSPGGQIANPLNPGTVANLAGSASGVQTTALQAPSLQASVVSSSEKDVLKSSGAWGESSEGEDFEYIPVSPWAPIALSLGLFGLTGFLGIFGLYVAFFGIFIGIAAVVRIRASAGFVKGTGLAVAGLVLSIASFVLGSAKMAHAYSTEVPDGFQRVNFPKDVAEKQFVYVAGHRKLHPDVASLIGKKVYLKGFMWATQDTEGLTHFILLKDNGECCFGGKPKSHDYIWIKLPAFNDGQRPALSYRSSGMSVKKLTDEEKKKLPVEFDFQLTTRAYLGMVAVAGVLSADVKAGENGPPDDYEFAPVYSMDAELVEDAWTRF
jgi:hypothetical protein